MSQSVEKILFVEAKNDYNNCNEVKDESWLMDSAFSVHITAQLNYLKLKLQGINKLITQLHDDVKCFIT